MTSKYYYLADDSRKRARRSRCKCVVRLLGLLLLLGCLSVMYYMLDVNKLLVTYYPTRENTKQTTTINPYDEQLTNIVRNKIKDNLQSNVIQDKIYSGTEHEVKSDNQGTRSNGIMEMINEDEHEGFVDSILNEFNAKNFFSWFRKGDNNIESNKEKLNESNNVSTEKTSADSNELIDDIHTTDPKLNNINTKYDIIDESSHDNNNKIIDNDKHIEQSTEKDKLNKNTDKLDTNNRNIKENDKIIDKITLLQPKSTENTLVQPKSTEKTLVQSNSNETFTSNSKTTDETYEDYANYGECSINTKDEDKFDCYPRGQSNQELCVNRGCCWKELEPNSKIPYCYYPKQYQTYKIVDIVNNTQGVGGFHVVWKNMIKSPYGNDIDYLNMNVQFLTENTLRVKISDANHTRYEPAIPEVPMYSGHKIHDVHQNYEVSLSQNGSGFAVIRKSDQSVIFDSRDIGGFHFADQFIQISSHLTSKYIYGLGENRNNFLLSTDWSHISLFTLDFPPEDNINSYGVHPFYLNINDKTGQSHGVFLKNSNAMDIILQPTPAITYRTIGGILDFYFFLGPTPSEVISQYWDIIGHPEVPPYWSLGFHLCRFGYKNDTDLQNVIKRNRDKDLPLDTVWVDIDYMDKHDDFAVDPKFKGLKSYVEQLHKEGLHFVPIIDPGIGANEGPEYKPYNEGFERKIFIMNSSNLPMEGHVWNDNGGTVFPDFSNPNTVEYWTDMFKLLYAQFKFDGAWIDMDEPSDFANGSLQGCPQNSSLEHPPYVPEVNGGLLSYKTLCMTGKQFLGSHYNLHNLYGTMETIATNFALKEILNKRAFIISRSTFSGQGHFGGHWTGDVYSTYDDMKHSVGDIMSFNMFGIPMVGADICGFNGNTTSDLCQRWLQLGAFYPFSRNHNSDDAVPQDPAYFNDEIINSTRKAFNIRYSLLPYLYSLFYRATLFGETVVRPLFFEFPLDNNTYVINTQFMWGPGFLISPALDQDQNFTETYLPKGIWYNYHTYHQIKSNGMAYSIVAPPDTIPLFLRGGYVLPGQIPAVTTTLSRKNGMFALVSLNETGSASGNLFWDDGDSLNTWEQKLVTVIQFDVSNGTLQTVVEAAGYTQEPMILSYVTVLGVELNVTKVTVNDQEHTKYNQTDKSLQILDLNLDLTKPVVISWQ